MSEADSNRCKMTWEVKWSYLPHDLLSGIADRLGLIDFLSFRGVCKDWRTASLKSSHPTKTCHLWFLMYGEGSQCSLLGNQDKIYTMDIRELDEATCLASYKGWLLFFCHGSMFFFCPFSKAKIELPSCPFSELSDHIAAFSSAPTSQDCIVAVISRISVAELELHLLCRGSNQWSKHKFRCLKRKMDTIRAAAFQEGEIHFLDRLRGLVTFDASKTKQWNYYRVVADESVNDVLNYDIFKYFFQRKDMKTKLGLEENVSISTCGSLHNTCIQNLMILSESIEPEGSESGHHFKGVWIQPRYFQIAPNQSW